MRKASILVSAFAIGILILVFPSGKKVEAQHGLAAPGIPSLRHLGVSRPLREIPPTLLQKTD